MRVVTLATALALGACGPPGPEPSAQCFELHRTLCERTVLCQPDRRQLECEGALNDREPCADVFDARGRVALCTADLAQLDCDELARGADALPDTCEDVVFLR